MNTFPSSSTRKDALLKRDRIDEYLIRRVQRSLTERDRYLCSILKDHRVLTTHQIADALYPSEKSARERLVALYRMRVVNRFRPYRQYGSEPFHYTLDVLGAAACAADNDEEPTLRKLRVADSWKQSTRLAHLIHTNDVFISLIKRARLDGNYALSQWWSEWACSKALAGLVYPDGYGVWSCGERSTAFFLETDMGTETLARVVQKLSGYEELQRVTGVRRWVLFWLPSETRERNLRNAMPPTAVPVATAVFGARPEADVWLPRGGMLRSEIAELGQDEASGVRPGSN